MSCLIKISTVILEMIFNVISDLSLHSNYLPLEIGHDPLFEQS